MFCSVFQKESVMEHVWEYVEEMTDGTYLDDEYLHESQQELQDWNNYYEEISDEIEY